MGLVDTPKVERLADDELGRIKPLLVELYLHEQPHYAGHPQFSRAELERSVADVVLAFRGENVIFGVRDAEGALAGFCWCVLFDPGTGLEGEVAEVFVDQAHRGLGMGRALVDAAVELFRERGVTLGYVWTRADNQAAASLYRGAGFTDNPQLVLTWYPSAGP